MSTIFAAITSPINAGVLVIRISGKKVLECLTELGVKKKPDHQKTFFHKIRDPKNSEIIDEALITYFQAPQSFTGENVAEISIHASPYILEKIFKILGEINDVRIAEAGEFSKRAFLNNKIDLVQAEAIPDLIAAETEAQHRQALKQLQGQLGKIYEDWRFRLIEISALIEAAIDFPDDDLPQDIINLVEKNVLNLRQEISQHLNDKKLGQKIKSGFNMAIIGAPNAGKSSLINFLAQSEVAIVSKIAGTTRDVIETDLEIAGVKVRISDTAGLRDTSDEIEAEGIKRALEKANQADLKLFLVDSQNPLIRQDLIDENTLVIANKIDLESAKSDQLNLENIISISLTNQINLDHLIKKIEEKVLQLAPKQSSPLITQERYRIALKNCSENLDNFSLQKNIELAAEDLRLAAKEIGKICGRVDVENILDLIFSRFCIGK